MKKYAILLVIMTLMLAGRAYAESVTVEGENYGTIGFDAKVLKGNDMSGQAVMEVLHQKRTGVKYEIPYQVSVSEPGNYNMVISSSMVGVGYTNDYFVSVNNEEPIPVNEAKVLGDVNSSTFPNLFRTYEIGPVSLHEGANTVTFIIDLEDTRDDGNVAFYLDYFTIAPLASGISSLKPTGPCGVFEKGRDVTFDMQYSGKTAEEVQYDFAATDFWGSTVIKDTMELAKGTNKKYTLNLGAFDTGWYRLRLYTADTKTVVYETTFSVVPPIAERIQGDTPFAADFASQAVLKSDTLMKDLAKTLKYAGIDWVRERYMWANVQPNAATYNYEDPDKRAKVFADEGINVSNTFHDIPGWTNVNNLFDVYRFQKTMAKRYDGKTQAWEIYNEQDGGFLKVSADNYAAFYKAAALGVVDSGAAAKVAFGGLCQDLGYNVFTDLMMKNQVSRYSDIYNFHSHSTYSGNRVDTIRTAYLSDNIELKAQYAEHQPAWITEAGLAMPLNGNDAPTHEQLMSQARYAVVSTMQSLASGVSKHFWFIWPAYVENGYEWGVFSKDGCTNPVYASEAVMTYKLGKGIYKGSLKRDDAEGYVFDNGENDVLVAWTPMPTTITLQSDQDVYLTDLMGQEKRIPSIDGAIQVDISYYPSYITFAGEMPVSEYYPRQYQFNNDKKLEFNDAERIILQQSFDELQQGQEVVKYRGYQFTPEKTVNMTVTVNNFNNKAMTGTIQGQLDGYDVQIADGGQVTIEAMSSAVLQVKLIPVSEPEYGVAKYLQFTGDFAGEKTSPTVSCINLTDTRPVENLTLFAGQDQPKSWDLTNITGGAAAGATQEDVLTFDLKFAGGDRWFYPKLQVQDPAALADTDGIAFWVKADAASVGAGNHNMFAYLRDGRWYFLGNMPHIYLTEDWVQVKRSWSDFVLFSSPLGQVDLRKFDPTLIDYISIGGNFRQDQIRYSIKDFGYYTNGDDQTGEEQNAVAFAGIKDGGNYRPEELRDITVTLPAKDYKKITVMATDQVIEPAAQAGNELRLDLSGLPKGDYTLRVIGEDSAGYKTAGSVRILVSR